MKTDDGGRQYFVLFVAHFLMLHFFALEKLLALALLLFVFACPTYLMALDLSRPLHASLSGEKQKQGSATIP